MKRLWPGFVALASLFLLSAQETTRAGSFEFQVIQQPEAIIVEHAGEPIAKYMLGRGQYKPYFSELRTTTGFNVLRDAPFDHHHHHGLMYGIKVNGVNFWEEISGSGVQKVMSTTYEKTSDESASRAVIRQKLYWLPAQDAFLPENRVVSLLIEHRTLTLTLDIPAKETRLLWQARFEVPGKTNVASLTGASYHGLGARFLTALDSISTHVSDSGSPDLSGTKQDVSKHPWEAVVFDSAEHKCTMAIFGLPGNARKEPMFFGMRNAFTYIAATQGLDKEPLVYKSGDTFEIGYLVLLYPEAKNQEWLSRRWSEFAEGK